MFIVDPGLTDSRGHHLSTSIRLFEAGRARFDEVIVVGNKRAENLPFGSGIVRVFTDSIYDGHPPSVPIGDDPQAIEATIRRPAAEFLSFLRTWRVGPDDIVYFHTLTPNFACCLIEALALLNPLTMASIAMMFRYDPETDPWVGSLDRLAHQVSRALAWGFADSFALFAETEDLSAQYSAALGQAVRPLYHFPTCIPPAAFPVRADGPVTVTYLGEARIEKGFDALAAAMTTLTRTRHQEDLRLVAQIYASDKNSGPIAAAMASMRTAVQYFDGRIETIVEDRDYYRLLLEADVIVVPHRLPNYKRRGSGIFVDALTFNTIILVRTGTWMSRFSDLSNIVTFDDDDTLAEKIEATIALAKNRQRIIPDQSIRNRFSVSAQIEALFAVGGNLEDGRAIMDLKKPKALVITRFWPNAGATHVFRNQVSMLWAAGFDVSVATFTSFAPDEEPDEATYQWYRDQMALPPTTFHWICFAHQGMLECMEEIARGITGAGQSWVAESLRVAASDLPDSLKAACRETPPALIVCNYLSHVPLANRLKGPATRIVVETHDISSLQYATTRDTKLCEADYRAELTVGRCADGLVFINEEGAAAFDRAGIDTPSVTVQPSRELSLDLSWINAIADAEKHLDRNSMVQATQHMLRRLTGTASNPVGAVRAGVAIRRAVREGKVLAYIGSDHEWNKRGIEAFLNTVFIPHLAPEGYTLLVVGSISEWLAQRFPGVRGLILSGALPDLRPIYESCVTLVLPVLGGAGFPIKTLDGLASGLPIVGTPSAFRGLDAAALGAKVAPLSDMAPAIKALASEAFTRHPPPAAFAFQHYCESWALFLSERLGRKIELVKELNVEQAQVAIDDATATLLASKEAPLAPLSCGSHDITPENLIELSGSMFGFSPRESETQWLWASSWYFGFLLASEARGSVLNLELTKVLIPEDALQIDVHVFIDGTPYPMRISEDTKEILIPLHEICRASDQPVLLEFIVPDALWRREQTNFLDDRVLSFCITKIATAMVHMPLQISESEYSEMTDVDFVTFSFRRILGKEADPDGLEYYTYVLSTGVTRNEVIDILARDPESKHPVGVVFV